MPNLPDPKQYPCTPEGYRAYYKALAECGRDAFFSHFDGGHTAAEYFSRSQWTWDLNIAPHLSALPRDMREVALEIGYGGGGLLRAAAGVFQHVAGVDVHDEGDFVSEYLAPTLGKLDVHTVDGCTLPFPDDSIDFVYSWTVLMHVVDEATLRAYLAEAYRVLRTGGMALLYVSRIRRSHDEQTLAEWLGDLAAEAGERLMIEVRTDRHVNQATLKCSLWYFDELARSIGFSVGTHVASLRERVGLPPLIGGQHTAVLVKV